MNELVNESNMVIHIGRQIKARTQKANTEKTHRNLVYINMPLRTSRLETDSSATGLGATGRLRKKNEAGSVRNQNKLQKIKAFNVKSKIVKKLINKL